MSGELSWAAAFVLPLIFCMTLGKLPTFSEPQLLPPYNEEVEAHAPILCVPGPA